MTDVFLKMNLPSSLQEILEATDYEGSAMLDILKQGMSQIDPRLSLANRTILVCEGIRYNPYKPELRKSLACFTFTGHEVCAYGEKQKDGTFDIRDEFARLTIQKFADPQLVAMLIHSFTYKDIAYTQQEPSCNVSTKVYSPLYEMVFERVNHCVLFDDDKRPQQVIHYYHPFIYLGGNKSAELLHQKVGSSFREMMANR
jgi:hypothetical protein